MFVALSRFVVKNDVSESDMSAEVRAAFLDRPHLVDDAPGYVRMDVISPRDNPDEFWLITYWEDEESFRVWHRGHTYHDAHKGIPKGLKLVRGEQFVRGFDHITS